MEILNLIQGTPEWHATRLQYGTASEAPAMMGRSKYMSRTKLLDFKKTGIAEDVTPAKQRLYDKGHEAEAKIRPVIEKLIDAELYPVTGVITVDGVPMLSSFDGLTMMEDVVFEHKLWNEELAENVRERELDAHYYWQLEQQLLVSGAEKAIFVVSDGTEENMAFMWYKPQPGRAEKLVAGWRQFFIDLGSHEVTEEKDAPTAEAAETLPAVSVQVSGEISIIGNLDKFGEALKTYTSNMNMKPETDQDFANLEAAGKALQKAEDALTAAENNALSQVESVEEMRRTVAEYRELARSFRLRAEKAVKAEKENRKKAIVTSAFNALHAHIESLVDELEGNHLPTIAADFAGAIKGKRSLASMQDAVDTTLAHAKIEADGHARVMRANLAVIGDLTSSGKALFADLQQIVSKPEEDFLNLVNARVAKHQKDEREREEQERERIREEERKRIEEEQQSQQEERDAVPAKEDGVPAVEWDAQQEVEDEPVQTQSQSIGGSNYGVTLASRSPFYATQDASGDIQLHTKGRNYRLSIQTAESLLDSLTKAISKAKEAA